MLSLSCSHHHSNLGKTVKIEKDQQCIFSLFQYFQNYPSPLSTVCPISQNQQTICVQEIRTSCWIQSQPKRTSLRSFSYFMLTIGFLGDC